MKTTLFALAALMITGVASAQDSALDLSGVTFKVGVSFPLDNKVSNFAKNLTNLGIEFNVPSKFGNNTESYLSADYFAKSAGTFGKGSALVLTFNQRFMKKATGTRQTYGYAGLGMGFMDITRSDQVFVVRGGFGINVSDQTFVEVGGTFSSKSSVDGSLNTIGLTFGYRF